MGSVPGTIFSSARPRLAVAAVGARTNAVDASIGIEKTFLVNQIIGEVVVIGVDPCVKDRDDDVAASDAPCVPAVCANQRNAVCEVACTADIKVDADDIRMRCEL